MKSKNQGRIDKNKKWDEIKKQWLDLYFGKKDQAGVSINRFVTASDEWCVEAYMETDYSRLIQEHFEETIRKYARFLVLYNRKEALLKPLLYQETPDLDTREWKEFCYNEIFEISRGKSKYVVRHSKYRLSSYRSVTK